ncbi:MAG: hypothetical protein L0387_26435 [Acidobacteria bacterium]|nr:hypothetical protein [Acidobacteriota bacterium]MCI0625139.1 hypothetical protein [Acidobacteriota bacterium]MCI0724227.1 hypothetical protein [Acidobacteriota bacterium]
MTSESDGIRLWRVRLDSGREIPLFYDGWRSVRWIDWLWDGSGLAMAGAELRSSPSPHQLWLVSNQGARTKLTHDLNDYRSVSLTRDGRHVLAVQLQHHSNLWVAPAENLGKPRQITFDLASYNGAKGVSWTADGRIVFASDSAAAMSLRMIARDGREATQLTKDSGDDANPSVSPDSSYAVFDSTRAGPRNIWSVNLQHGTLRRLTFGSLEQDPIVSRDGRWVIYSGLTNGRLGLHKIPIDGGQSLQLSLQTCEFADVCPDGSSIACYSWQGNGDPAISILRAAGGEVMQMLTLPVTSPRLVRWSPDGRALVFVRQDRDKTCLVSQPIAGGPPKLLTDFGKDQVFAFDWSPDGKWLSVSRGGVVSDAVMFSGFR